MMGKLWKKKIVVKVWSEAPPLASRDALNGNSL